MLNVTCDFCGINITEKRRWLSIGAVLTVSTDEQNISDQTENTYEYDVCEHHAKIIWQKIEFLLKENKRTQS